MKIKPVIKSKYIRKELQKKQKNQWKDNRWRGGSCPKYTDKELLYAIEKSSGFIGLAAKRLGITYQAIWNRLHDKKKFKQLVKSIREQHLDFSESKLLKNIEKGKEQSIFFHLRSLGKHRGYVDRKEITGANGKPFQASVNISIEDRLKKLHEERNNAVKEALEKGEYIGDINLSNGQRVKGNNEMLKLKKAMEAKYATRD